MVQLLVNGGELDGVRLLSPKTVQLMMTNHVGSGYDNPGFGELGFGYGFQLTLDLAQLSNYGGTSDLHYKWRSLVYQALVR